ncbi:hypothetical protein DIR46_18360 [Massilia oculi]|uniref:Uncharacterized protein n=1 Tax=Massilia oculi TaxID=945844 RepID=A0A2S2DM86_9BURK|nr:hypothetical protein DIR46_18360 [Massilia oculi]
MRGGATAIRAGFALAGVAFGVVPLLLGWRWLRRQGGGGCATPPPGQEVSGSGAPAGCFNWSRM